MPSSTCPSSTASTRSSTPPHPASSLSPCSATPHPAALADTWSTATPHRRPVQPLRGRRGPQRPAAIQLDGVLFMEGEGRPPRSPTSSGTCGRPPRTSPPPASGCHTRCRPRGTSPRADRRRRPRRHARRAAPHHRQRLARRRHQRTSSPASSTRGRHPRPRRLRAGRTPADLAGPRDGRLLDVRRRTHRPGRRPLQRSAGLVNDNERRWRVFRQRVARSSTSQPTPRPTPTRPPIPTERAAREAARLGTSGRSDADHPIAA